MFTHPDGRTEDLGDVRPNVSQVALLSYLAAGCPTKLSVEVGFGMGTSATAILGSRARGGASRYEHLIFDPYGLPDGKGLIVADYLASHFGQAFRWLKEPSEVGLGTLLAERGKGCAGLIFIDGGHHFENVMTDFALADHLCCRGGHIVFDDALYPAIESVLNYIKANRPDCAVSLSMADNCGVVQKIDCDRRQWDSFAPFPVPNRCNWTPRDTPSTGA